MQKIEVILVGAFHETIELCNSAGFSIIGIFDNLVKNSYWNCDIIGTDEDAEIYAREYSKIPVILTPDQPITRKSLSEKYSSWGYNFVNLISPHAIISNSAKLGEGIVVQNGVNISSNVTIHNFVKLNSFSNIMHDSVINPFTTIAPNAVVLGRVNIGELSYIGANSTILPGRIIGNKTIIGAGSVITKDFSDNLTIVGNPGRIISNVPNNNQ
jgi:sugar O-acyltransferase (sialic acid O-acetyltransferase NeuD family)